MVISTKGLWHKVADTISTEMVVEIEEATVYGDFEQERVLHKGQVRILPNGWVVLPTDRVLSPEAVHHIDA